MLFVRNLRRRHKLQRQHLLSHDFPSNLPDEPGKKSYLHIHTIPNAGHLTYTFVDPMDAANKRRAPGTIDFTPGPSDSDREQASANMQSKGVRTVLVDPKYVYLLNGTNGQTIKIPR